MVNFHPNLQESTDERLYQYINQSDPLFGALASDELSRRALIHLFHIIGSLRIAVEQSSDDSRELQASNNKLQTAMLVLTVVTTIVATFPAVKYLTNLGKPILASLLNAPAIQSLDWTVISAIISIFVGFFAAYLSGRVSLDGDFIVFHRKKEKDGGPKS